MNKASLSFDRDKGHCRLLLFGKAMLGSVLDARIGSHQAVLASWRTLDGEDRHGSYEGFELQYRHPLKPKRRFKGLVKHYSGMVVFETRLQAKLEGKKNKHRYGHPYVSFPCFEGSRWEGGLSMLSFKRQAPFNYPEQWYGKVYESVRDGKHIPLMATSSSFETVLLSPMDHFLHNTVSISHDPPSLRCGIPRSVDLLPRGTVWKTLLVYGSGVNCTWDRWGEALRREHGTAAIVKDADVLLEKLSYWTNAGSAYWYNVYKKGSYASTLACLKKHHEAIGLPIGSCQLDSWWYAREDSSYTAGIVDWQPKETTFRTNYNALAPFKQRKKAIGLFGGRQLADVQSLLDKPIGLHFKQLSQRSVHVNRHPDDFLLDGFAMPRDYKSGKRLFKELFDHPGWRLSYVVHDWLSYMEGKHKAFRSLKAGSDYFRSLDKTLRSLDAPDNRCGHITLQLCMTQPHMTLHSVTLPSATTIRSTSDSSSFFVEGTHRWWWHLYSSRFIQALGKYAFYDNRFSFKSHTHPLSAYAKFEFIWLGLSCGPIGLGDPIGKENLPLLARVVDDAGRLLKPDVPAVPTDAAYLADPLHGRRHTGFTVYSHSCLGHGTGTDAPYRLYYALTFNMHPYGLAVGGGFRLADLGAGGLERHAVYDWFSGSLRVCTPNEEIRCRLGRRKFLYQLAAPIRHGFAFLGDASKHVSGSPLLVEDVDIQPGVLRARLAPRQRHGAQWLVYSEKHIATCRIDGRDVPFNQTGSLARIAAGPSEACLLEVLSTTR